MVVRHLGSGRAQLQVFALAGDHGVGGVAAGRPESRLGFTPEEIVALTDEDLTRNRAHRTNLKPPGHFEVWIASPGGGGGGKGAMNPRPGSVRGPAPEAMAGRPTATGSRPW